MKYGTIERFLDAVAASMKCIGNEESTEVFFRGQATREWQLQPTLHRFVNRLNSLPGQDVADTTDIDGVESALYWEFRSKAISLRGKANSGWDYLFWARHHGVPTRLMDWTENLFVALYFALVDEPGHVSTPRIWLLNPYRLNKISMSSDELYHPKYLAPDDYDALINSYDEWGWDLPVALYPEQSSPRQHAQQGWFTVHGNDERSLEDQQESLIRKVLKIKRATPVSMEQYTPKQLATLAEHDLPFLAYIDLQKDDVVALTKLLRLSGRSRYSIYQDLDSLAKDTIDRFVNP